MHCNNIVNDFPSTKGQFKSEWINEVIVSPKMQNKNYKDFGHHTNKDRSTFFDDFLVSGGSFFGYNPYSEFNWPLVFQQNSGKGEKHLFTFFSRHSSKYVLS